MAMLYDITIRAKRRSETVKIRDNTDMALNACVSNMIFPTISSYAAIGVLERSPYVIFSTFVNCKPIALPRGRVNREFQDTASS